LFRLGGVQRFGINVFKVREVIQCPPLTQVPKSHRVVRGIVNIRGKTIPVLDLGLAIGLPPVANLQTAFLVITEYNRRVQGFLVRSVDRIVNHNWQEILPPPKGSAAKGYLTAVTKVDDELVEVLDVERVMAEVVGISTDITQPIETLDAETKRRVLIVDDSVVARNQVKRTVEQIGGETVLASDGHEALELLMHWASDEPEELAQLTLVISDIEMPQMDGYTLVTEIRKQPALAHLPVVLHTSMSGNFNKAMVEKVGADEFVAKFEPNELAAAASRWLTRDHPLS
jgi:two-component system chemotaxis response regulator CheV